MTTQRITVVEGEYFRDLMAQPAALQATLEWLSSGGRWDTVRRFLQSGSWSRIVLTGMGSSFHALHPLNLGLLEAGATPILMETSELVHYGRGLLDHRTLLVAASQSGRSAETLRLLEVNKQAPILAITNTADSPLARAGNCLLLTQAGPEASVSCKTYVSMLLAIEWLTAATSGKEEREIVLRLQPSATLAAQYLHHWKEHTQELAARLREIRHLFFIGRGDSLAAVGTGALIVKESARAHAEGMSSASFRHGPMEMLQSGMHTAVFTGDRRTSELNRQLIRDLIARGGTCDEIGADSPASALRLPASDSAIRPMLEILPIQMMSLALAALAGREAGRFQHATKVTAVE